MITRETRKEQRDERDRRIMEFYLACWTEADIGNEVGLDEDTIQHKISAKKGEFRQIADIPPSSFQPYTLLQVNSCRKFQSRKPRRKWRTKT